MKTQFKTLVYATAVLSVFLACSNSPNNQVPEQITPKCKQIGYVSLAIGDVSSECKSKNKKVIRISEMHWEETNWDYLGGSMSGSMSSTGEIYYTLNGERMSKEEYEKRMAEYWAKYQEQQKGKRDLSIPCVISDDAVGWTALLTDEEASELLEKYGELLFSEELGSLPVGDNAESAIDRKGECN